MTPFINPFVVSGHIADEYFCDRKEESEQLKRFLSNQQNVVLSAARRMGKTALVDHVFAMPDIAGNYITISIDILDTNNFSDFVFTLGNAVFEKVAQRSDKLMKLFPMVMKSLQASFGYDSIRGSMTFDIKLGDIVRPEYTLQEIFQFLANADQRCLVVIDEFQQITYYPEANVEATLRKHIQKAENVNFVFAGSHRRIMSEMFGSEQRPFFNSADIQHLDVISEDKYSDFVRHHFAVNGKRIDDETISKVYHIFEGNTYYNQKTFREAFAMTPADGLCNQETTDQVVSQMVNEANRHYSELFSRLTLPQKELLYAIAKEQRARQITSGDFIRRHSLKSASSVQSSIKKLLAYALVSTENNEYFIADQLMRLWLLR